MTDVDVRPQWSFIEKTPVKQHLKCKVCSNFQMSFLHLVRWTPSRWGFGSGLHFGQILSQTDLWSDVPPCKWGFGSGCHFVRSLGQADLWLDVTHMIRPWVRLTFSQAYLWTDIPPAETSGRHMCYYFGQVDLWSEIPPDRDILWPNVYYLSQADLWSNIPPTITLWVRLTFS